MNQTQSENQTSSEQTQTEQTQTEQTQTEQTGPENEKPEPAEQKPRRRNRGRRSGASSSEWTLDQFKVQPEADKVRFHDLGLPLSLMHAIADLGFQFCSPIQARSLPYALRGHDVVGKAQTGTGKTAAFLVTIIEDLLKNPIEGDRYAGEARSLIIAPTRELVMQIAEDAKGLCKYTDLNVHTLVGGMDYDKQRQRLHERHCDILVATPGRLLDFCNSRYVYLDQTEILVIDEADRMLDMGFIPQVRNVIRLTPQKGKHRQTLLFSATFTEAVMRLSEQWTDKPSFVEIEPESVASDSVDQKVFIIENRNKFNLLRNILRSDDVESVIVFANRRDQCRKLQESLSRAGFKSGLLSGEIPQNKRIRTLDDFKTGKIKVLVATDVAGRGIHIDGISHVVNYTLPEEPEDYVHRIGRTGRAGKTGTSVSFACEDDAFLLEPIEKLLGEKLSCEQPPEELLAANVK